MAELAEKLQAREKALVQKERDLLQLEQRLATLQSTLDKDRTDLQTREKALQEALAKLENDRSRPAIDPQIIRTYEAMDPAQAAKALRELADPQRGCGREPSGLHAGQEGRQDPGPAGQPREGRRRAGREALREGGPHQGPGSGGLGHFRPFIPARGLREIADQEVGMFQAVKLDSAPSQVKARPGGGSDPAETAFAGLMAQASLASMTPAAPSQEAARQDAPQPRETTIQRAEPGEVQAVSRPQEPEHTKTAPGEIDDEGADPAKAAVPREAAAGKQGAPPSLAEAPAPSTSTAAVAASGMPLPAAAPSDPAQPTSQAQTQMPTLEAMPGGSQGQTPQPGEQAPEQGGDPGLQALVPKLPQGSLPQKGSLPAVKLVSPGPVLKDQPALQGPGKDIHPEAPKPTPAEPVKPVGEGKPIAAPAAGPEAATSQFPVLEDGRLPKLEVPVPQPQKVLPTAQEAMQVGLAEGPPRLSTTTLQGTDPTAARPSPVFNQVEGSIRWILQNKVQGAELQLHPESLGRMVIQLRVEGQEVHARLWASESTSLALLQDHKTFLQASLKEQGLNLGSFDLQSGARGDGAQTMPQERPPVALPTPEPQQEMPTGAVLDSAAAHRIEVFA